MNTIDNPSGCADIGHRIRRRRPGGLRYRFAGLVGWALDLRRRALLAYYRRAYVDLSRRDPGHPDLAAIACAVIDLTRPEDSL